MNNFTDYNTTRFDIKYLLIYAISLLSIKLYTLFLTYSLGKAVVFLGAVIIIALFVIHAVYGSISKFPKGFTIPLLLIFVAIVLSTFGAYLWHEQRIAQTLFEQYDLYFFLFYFLLHQLRPDPKKLLDMFVMLGLVYCSIYIVQYLIYPRSIVAITPFIDRGTLRIFLPGSGYLFSAYFISLSRFFITKKPKHLLILIPMLIVVLLLGTRQVMASIALLTLLNILLSKTIKSKAITFVLIGASLIPFFFLFQGIIMEMFNLTVEQSGDVSDNVRVRASAYFLFNYNPDMWWTVVGNGYPSHSSVYGKNILRLSEEFGYYQEDIGIIGDFVKFGALFVIGQLFFLFKLVFSKTKEINRFILYNTLSILMTMFTGSGLHAHTIIIICMMMYIADVDKYLLQQIEAKELAAKTN